MNLTASAPPRCFMHVPKSGGTSVHVALEQALPSGTISPKRQDATGFCCGFSEYDLLDPRVRATMAIRDDEIAALSDYPVISGHFSLSTLLRLTSASAVATILREPRARILSEYAWLRVHPDRKLWAAYPLFDHALRPLDEYLTEPLVAAATDNLMCRMLLGDDPRIPELGFIAESNIDTVARDAMGKLETLGYVGVLELGDVMWEGLSGFFAAPLAPTWLNKTESHSEVGDMPTVQATVTLETLDALNRRTAADSIVYRHVVLTNGYSGGHVDRVQATAFAAELVRIGNLFGKSAAEARTQSQRSEELARQLLARDEELERVAALAQETRQQLAEINEQLRWHRLWLEAIQGSPSWRLTAPLRAAKRTLRRLPSSAARVAGRAGSEG